MTTRGEKLGGSGGAGPSCSTPLLYQSCDLGWHLIQQEILFISSRRRDSDSAFFTTNYRYLVA